jgi:hypothetical protein
VGQAKHWYQAFLARAWTPGGLRAGYFVGDPVANRVQAICLWDSKPVEELEESLNDYRHQCREIILGPGRREGFEVLAEA